MNSILTFIVSHIEIVFGLILLIVIISFFVYASKINKRNKKLKETQLPRRFKYLDTFYFSYYDGEDTQTISFNIIEDLSNSNKYAMITNQFDHCFFVEYKEPRLVTGKKGFTHKMPKVEFEQQGNYWVANEIENAISNENGLFHIHFSYGLFKRDFTLVYDKKNHPDIKRNYIELFHLNQLIDISVLNNITFIDGIAEFDNIYNSFSN